jgi:hypothetical protein
MDNSALKLYELTDKEDGLNLKKFDDKVKKEMKKQEKPKSKPSEIFEGFKDTKKKKRVKKNNPRFSKKSDPINKFY